MLRIAMNDISIIKWDTSSRELVCIYLGIAASQHAAHHAAHHAHPIKLIDNVHVRWHNDEFYLNE